MRLKKVIGELKSGELSLETKVWILKKFWIISLFMLVLGYLILFLLLFGERINIPFI
jgi:hypothetical protein